MTYHRYDHPVTGVYLCVSFLIIFCFKQKTAYEVRISDCSSDVCSSDLRWPLHISGLITSTARALPSRTASTAAWIPKRSEERSVGKERVGTCRPQWSTYK